MITPALAVAALSVDFALLTMVPVQNEAAGSSTDTETGTAKGWCRMGAMNMEFLNCQRGITAYTKFSISGGNRNVR